MREIIPKARPLIHFNQQVIKVHARQSLCDGLLQGRNGLG